jgi:hypothetical protein
MSSVRGWVSLAYTSMTRDVEIEKTKRVYPNLDQQEPTSPNLYTTPRDEPGRPRMRSQLEEHYMSQLWIAIPGIFLNPEIPGLGGSNPGISGWKISYISVGLCNHFSFTFRCISSIAL